MRQLIWKEWHEQAWKLAFGCIVLGAFAFIGLRTRILPDEEMLLWVCFPAIGLLPLLAATGLVPTERSDGTFNTLAALPVPMRTIVWIKIAVGLLLCVGPLAVTMAISLGFVGGRKMNDSVIIALFVRSMLSAAAVFVWMFAASIRLPTEARAAMVSIGVLLFWLMASTGMAWAKHWTLSTISPVSFSALAQLSNTHLATGAPSLTLNLLVETLIAATLCAYATRSVSSEVAPGN